MKICYNDREMWCMHNDDLIYSYDYAGPKGPNALVWIGHLYITYTRERKHHTHKQAWDKALQAFCENCFKECGTSGIYDLPMEWEVEFQYIQHALKTNGY